MTPSARCPLEEDAAEMSDIQIGKDEKRYKHVFRGGMSRSGQWVEVGEKGNEPDAGGCLGFIVLAVLFLLVWILHS